ncbi:MAG: hypothetical protein P1U32_05855 [Legionellaceae bacterium]|nr:hypothetical protein [Legionellaceae bacterium]
MPLSEQNEADIQQFKNACTESNAIDIYFYHRLLMSEEGTREELFFRVIPEILITLITNTTPNHTEIANWLLNPGHMPQEDYYLNDIIPQALLRNVKKNPQQLQRLLEWSATRPLFKETQRALQRTFLHAIVNSEEAAAATLLQHLPGLAALNINDGTSPLMLAASASAETVSTPIIIELLNAGANPNGDLTNSTLHTEFSGVLDAAKHRPIHHAIIQGSIGAFEALVHGGADLERPDIHTSFTDAPNMQAFPLYTMHRENKVRKEISPFTPLILVMLYERGEMLQFLNTKAITLPSNDTVTAEAYQSIQLSFLRAIISRETGLARLLLERYPALATLKVNGHMTPLTLATSARPISLPIVSALLRAGANPNGDVSDSMRSTPLPEYFNSFLQRPIHSTITKRDKRAFEILLNAEGIDLERPDGFEGLCETAPDIQPLSLDAEGYTESPSALTPAVLAVIHHQGNMLERLQSKGIVLPACSVITQEAYQSLQLAFLDAVMSGKEQIVSLLLEYSPEFAMLRADAYASPLALATSVKPINLKIVGALLKAGVNPNGDVSETGQDIEHFTCLNMPRHRPLHATIISGNLDAFKMLLNATDINLSCQDGFNRPAISLFGNQEPTLFEQRRTRKTAPSFTPITLAMQFRHTEMFELLRAKGVVPPSNGDTSQSTLGRRPNPHRFSCSENVAQRRRVEEDRSRDNPESTTHEEQPLYKLSDMR